MEIFPVNIDIFIKKSTNDDDKGQKLGLTTTNEEKN